MRKKLINITIIFIFIISIITIPFLKGNTYLDYELEKGRQLIYVNEIRKEIESENIDNKALINSIENLDQHIKSLEIKKDNNNYTVYNYIVVVIFILVIYIYTYFIIVRPFEKMENFAREIGKGNLNINLKYERKNLFGAFTWAFDHMRKEILKARSCEKEAIDNNKTVIATLSHDIKTPVASIRAYAEGLEANLDYNYERRQKYIDVILRKCDEVSKLTEDLFLHSLSDLDMLKINSEEVEISKVIKESIFELVNNEKIVNIIGELPRCNVNLDVNRFKQVINNIINNSIKYAPNSNIDVKATLSDESYIVSIRDYGQGLLDEDIPFIFHKFYRGKNIKDNKGAGLGLYIVKYIVEQLKGNVELINNNGLEVKVILPIKVIS